MYRLLDIKIGQYVQKSDEDTTIILMSDHGFGPLTKNLYVNNWLSNIGLLKFKATNKTKLKCALNRYGFNLQNIYRMLITLRLEKITLLVPKRVISDIVDVSTLSFLDIDWENTKAYSFGHFGRIYINLKGRETFGSVEMQDYELFMKYISKRLMELEDPESNEKIVDNIWRGDEIYDGPIVKSRPDILFSMKNYQYATDAQYAFASNKIFDTSLVKKSGEHRPNGIFLFSGNIVNESSGLEFAKIYDLAPTILHMFGTPIPRDMDGRVLTEIFREDSEMAQREIVYEEDKTKAEKNKDALKNKIGKLKTKRKI